MESINGISTRKIESIQKIKEVDSIQYLKGDINYTSLIYRNGHRKMIAHTLKRFEESNIFEGFLRVHRAYLVNPKFIVSVSLKDYSLELVSGVKLPISRRKLLNFKN